MLFLQYHQLKVSFSLNLAAELFISVPNNKKRTLGFVSSHDPPELPGNCSYSVLYIRKNLQPGNIGTLLITLWLNIPNHRCPPIYLVRPVKLLPLEETVFIHILCWTILYGGDSVCRTYLCQGFGYSSLVLCVMLQDVVRTEWVVLAGAALVPSRPGLVRLGGSGWTGVR